MSKIKRLLCADAALFLLGAILKTFHLPGAGVTIFFSALFGCILLFCAVFQSRPINILKILFYLEGILFIIGSTFKLYQWTGDSFIFLIACILGIVLLLYTAIFHKFDK